MRAVLDRAMEQQAGMVSPKRYIGNLAQKRKIELLQGQVEQLQKQAAELQTENGTWKKSFEYN